MAKIRCDISFGAVQKYRLYLKRVAGVQLTPSGRGKASRSNSLDAAGYGMMGIQPPMSMMPQGGLGALSDQEQLRMSLQMAHMRNQQAAMGSAQAEVEFLLCITDN